MKKYIINRQYSTGTLKTHTIELSTGRRISVVYYEEKYIDFPETAIAIASDGTTYRVFESNDGSKALAIKNEVKE